jgi:hypothetical protein
MATQKTDRTVIFRRYRTLPNGKVLDARNYGLKAWPISVSGDQKPKH